MQHYTHSRWVYWCNPALTQWKLKMKTEETVIKYDISAWAVPSEYEDTGKLPFRYITKLGNDTPWQDGAVKLHKRELALVVPAGIDLLEKAIETLKGEIQKTRAEAQVKVEKYEKHMESLLQLTYVPTNDE